MRLLVPFLRHTSVCGYLIILAAFLRHSCGILAAFLRHSCGILAAFLRLFDHSCGTNYPISKRASCGSLAVSIYKPIGRALHALYASAIRRIWHGDACYDVRFCGTIHNRTPCM